MWKERELVLGKTGTVWVLELMGNGLDEVMKGCGWVAWLVAWSVAWLVAWSVDWLVDWLEGAWG